MSTPRLSYTSFSPQPPPTVDDDIRYPSTLVEDLLAGVTRHPNAAVGFTGYKLNSTSGRTSLGDDGKLRVNRSLYISNKVI